jgi:hypothetical protein
MEAEDRELIVRHLIAIMEAVETEDAPLLDEALICLEFYTHDDAYKTIVDKLEDLAVAQLAEAK